MIDQLAREGTEILNALVERARAAEADEFYGAVLDRLDLTGGDLDRYLRLFGEDDLPNARETRYSSVMATVDGIIGGAR